MTDKQKDALRIQKNFPKAKRFWKQGLSPEQIALRLGETVSEINGWIEIMKKVEGKVLPTEESN